MRFRPELSRKCLFSGISPSPDHGNPRLPGHRRTLAKHLFRESQPIWLAQRPKSVAERPNRWGQKFRGFGLTTPVASVGHRLLQQGRDHTQRRFTFHRGWAGRHARLQGLYTAAREVTAPEANRIFAHTERLGDPRTGPAG